MDEAQRLLKEALQGRRQRRGTPSACPGERELWAYLAGDLDSAKEEALSQHVASCDACLDSLLLAQEVRPGIGFDPREGLKEELLRKVKSFPIHKGLGRQRGLFRKNRWLFLALVFLGLSFLIPRYFLQSLFLAGLFGAKWVFDSATNRTLIVMYEAWKQRARKEDELIRR